MAVGHGRAPMIRARGLVGEIFAALAGSYPTSPE